jgi:hypothetical protein
MESFETPTFHQALKLCAEGLAGVIGREDQLVRIGGRKPDLIRALWTVHTGVIEELRILDALASGRLAQETLAALDQDRLDLPRDPKCSAIAKHKAGETHPLLAILRERGLTRVEVGYDGCGDEGFVEYLRCWVGDKEVSESNRQDRELNEAIDRHIYAFLDELPFNWVNGSGGYGAVEINVASGRVRVEHSQRSMGEFSQKSYEVQL